MDPGALQLCDTHFLIYDDKFEYSNVRGIRWRWIERVRSIYFIPIGAAYTYELTIEFVNGPPLDMGVGSVQMPSILSPAMGRKAFTSFESRIKDLFVQTREYRLAPYGEQMQRDGFFEYDGGAFYADGSVNHKGRRRNLDLKSRAEARDASTKLKCLPGGSIEISTLWDRDCFHVMLNEMYGPRRT